MTFAFAWSKHPRDPATTRVLRPDETDGRRWDGSPTVPLPEVAGFPAVWKEMRRGKTAQGIRGVMLLSSPR